MDLAGFAECERLEEIEVDMCGEPSYSGEVKVSRLGRLPAACTVVVLVPHHGGGDISVVPEFGWHINVEGGPGGRILVRRTGV